MTAKILGVPTQTLGNRVRRSDKGQLAGAGDKPVSQEQIELARLCAELSRVKMERDMLKNTSFIDASKIRFYPMSTEVCLVISVAAPF